MNERLSKLRDILTDKNYDALLISSPSNLIYLTSYPFEPMEREAFLVITKTKHYMIVSPLIQEEVKKVSRDFICISPPFGSAIKEICKKENMKKLGIEADNLTLSEYKSIKSPQTKLIPVVLETLRDVKDTEEISSIEKACSIGDEAFAYILTQIKPGMSEKDVAFLLESFIRKTGTEISFKTIVAFGKNAAVPHHVTDNTKLAKHDSILLDFGVRYNNYCSDMSRTIFIGTPTSDEKKVYETVQIAQEKAIEFLHTSNHAKSVDKIARDYILSQGYPEYPHSLGHSIGIDVHDGFRLSLASKNALTEGMVFSIEPGIYLPNKIGVRIEDIVVLGKNGPRLLTKSSRQLTIISF